MAKKTLKACRTASDFVAYAQAHGGEVITCGKGVKILKGRKDQYAVIHSNHPRELASGTRSALIKMFVAIGLAGSIACMVMSLPVFFVA
jgi:hypothetical protein